jgi:hypothetical protein
MKRLIILFLLTIGLTGIGLTVSSGSAKAADGIFSEACKAAKANLKPGDPEPAACRQTGDTDPISGADSEGILIKATRLVAMLTGIAAIIAIMLGGIEYVMSSGDPAKLNTAKNTIIFAVGGLFIAASAQFIITFVLSRL